MTYVGQGPGLKTTNIKRLDVTGSTSATHVLSWTAVSEQALIITINGVKQQDDAYTIAGSPTTVTLSSALVSADKLEIIGIVDMGVSTYPVDGSVSTASLGNTSVTTAKIAADAVTATEIATGAVGTTEIATNAVDTAEIAANAVTLTELADGTQGGTLYYGAAGAPTQLAAGTSGQFLKTQGAGQNPVWGSVTEYNDTALRNDIGTLALHSATASNQAAYNLTNAFIDQYEDSSGIDTTTQVDRTSQEYVASVYTALGKYQSDANTIFLLHSPNSAAVTAFTDSSSNSIAITQVGSGSIASSLTQVHTGYGTTSLAASGTGGLKFADNIKFALYGTYWCIDYWQYGYASGSTRMWSIIGNGGWQLFNRADARNGPPGNYGGITGFTSPGQNAVWSAPSNYYNPPAWVHTAVVRDNTTFRLYYDGIQRHTVAISGNQGWTNQAFPLSWFSNDTGSEAVSSGVFIDEIRVSDVVRFPSGTTFTPGLASANFPNGNYTSTTQTALATVTEMSIIVLYKNNAGTNTLNVGGDLWASISADGGSNYQTVTLTAGGTFSTGILVAKADKVTISNTGTAPKYKINFANQASGTKEAQVYGVALLY